MFPPLRARQTSLVSAITTVTTVSAATDPESSSAALSTLTSDPSSSSTALFPSSSDFRSSSTSDGPSPTTSTSFIQSSTFFIPTVTSVTATSPLSGFLSSSTSPSTPPTTAPSSSASPVLSSTSGVILSTFTSSFVTDIDGSPTTIVTPIVTALRTSSPSRVSTRSSVIAGSTVAGVVVFIIALTTVFILRRRARRQRYWALSRKPLPSRATFLVGEEMDLPFPSPPFASADRDDLFASHSSSHRTSSATSIDGGVAFYPHSHHSRSQSSHIHATSSSPPRLLRARASESGSIFQESVWPPPSAGSQLIDPLTSPSQSVDLGRIVNDVMGAQGASTRDAPQSGPLLPTPSPARYREPEEDQGQGQERLGEQVPTPQLPLVLTNPDDWPLSQSESHSQPSRLHQSRPWTPPPLPQPARWLSRSPNPSPRGSSLHLTHPI